MDTECSDERYDDNQAAIKGAHYIGFDSDIQSTQSKYGMARYYLPKLVMTEARKPLHFSKATVNGEESPSFRLRRTLLRGVTLS
jgi:hypothetical protein